MDFNIPRNTLLAGIRKTLGIVEKKTTQPILNNVLLRIKENRLTIIATDVETTLVANYGAEVLSGGEITVSAKKLYEMIREIPEGIVHVKRNEGNTLVVSCQKAVYRISGIPAEEFPSIGEENSELSLCPLEKGILLDLIGKSFFAISQDETRPNLTGAFLEAEESGGGSSILRMVATDGHRLAVVDSVPTGQKVSCLPKGVIIPRKGLLEIKRLLEEDNTGDVFFGIDGGLCVIKSGEDVLKVSLIDAEFPNYRRVIPQEKGINVSVEKEKILHALKRINVISSEGYGGVVVNVKENLMVLTFQDSEVGDASDEIEIKYTGEEIIKSYNINYFLAAVEVIDDQQVNFEIGIDSKPSVVRGSGNDRYMCIIMPLKE
ncbi:MAG TPA: DNA polymerase III subunit beta [Candidatus Wunengus sp. YC60]|uniref:DNA polymerase III subunit beta n=1 Tax=Candidatus Wunengus sp. YC60 TaxID=3367697 RepID=UPI00402748EE